jgi:hypothetical protein
MGVSITVKNDKRFQVYYLRAHEFHQLILNKANCMSSYNEERQGHK